MSIRGTRVPETAGRSRGAPPPVRYDTSLPWPGITAEHPRDWCDSCTRAYLHGTYQVKQVNAMCETHVLGRRR